MTNCNRSDNSWENWLWILVIVLTFTLIFAMLRSQLLAAEPDDFVAQIEQLEAMAVDKPQLAKSGPLVTLTGTLTFDDRGFRLVTKDQTFKLVPKFFDTDLLSYAGAQVNVTGRKLGYINSYVETFEVESITVVPGPNPYTALPTAPANNYLHDCACPSSASCNCLAGQCHCAENRVSNRQPMQWVHDEDGWHLYRGSQCLGALNSKGSYYPWLGSDYARQPTKLPMPLPTKQYPQTAPQAFNSPAQKGEVLRRTWTGGPGGRRC